MTLPFAKMLIHFMLLLLGGALTLGCTRPDYELAEVDGQLIVKGQPGARSTLNSFLTRE